MSDDLNPLLSELEFNDAELGDLFSEVDDYELARAAREATQSRYQMVGNAWKLKLTPGDPDSDELVKLMSKWSDPKALEQVAKTWRSNFHKPSARAVDDGTGYLRPWPGAGPYEGTNVGKVVRFLHAFTDLLG